jgi:hypothetical protein
MLGCAQTRTLYDLPDGAKQWGEFPSEVARIDAAAAAARHSQKAFWQTPA